MRGPLLRWEGEPVELQNVEAVVRRLFSDAEFRATAIASPSTALAAYELQSDEQVALTKLSAQLADGENIGMSINGYWF
jgi:hypothetical protein